MDDFELKGAILQRDKETYAIVPRTPLGLLTPDNLEKLAAVARKYEVPVIKITSGQRIALVGFKPQDLDAAREEISLEVAFAQSPCMQYVQACPGTDVCRMGLQDSLGLGAQLDKEFMEMDLPAKVKMGVSGCGVNCAESYVRDLGVIGRKKGWLVIFGGNAGSRTRIGDVIAKDISGEEVLALARKALGFYAANAKKKERTARFVERIGLEDFKKEIGVE